MNGAGASGGVTRVSGGSGGDEDLGRQAVAAGPRPGNITVILPPHWLWSISPPK